MAILGVESVIFGVDDLGLCSKFWEDFGLTPLARSAKRVSSRWHPARGWLYAGATIPVFPSAYADKPGIRETIWGVDTPEALHALFVDLSRDRQVRQDADGTLHFTADDGMPLGLRVWKKRMVVSQPDPVNAPGNIQRLNLHRKWRRRAIPKTINHVVFFAHDYVASLEFFRATARFRYSGSLTRRRCVRSRGRD